MRSAYIHALLVALTNPYRFTQRENSEIYELARIWSALCELREGRAPAGAIAVRTDSDSSPGYLPEERETPSEGLWALELNGLVRSLESQLAGCRPEYRRHNSVRAAVRSCKRTWPSSNDCCVLAQWRRTRTTRIAAGHSSTR